MRNSFRREGEAVVVNSNILSILVDFEKIRCVIKKLLKNFGIPYAF